MAAGLGREIVIEWGDGDPQERIPCREKTISLNGQPINTTNDDDDGVRKLIDATDEDMIDISVSGVTKSRTLRQDWLQKNRRQTLTITYPDGDVIAGVFYLSPYEDTGPYQDAITFSATFSSADTWTYTPGA